MGICWRNADSFLAQTPSAEVTSSRLQKGIEKVPGLQLLRGLDEKKRLQHFLTPHFDQLDGFNITEIFHFSMQMGERERKKKEI